MNRSYNRWSVSGYFRPQMDRDAEGMWFELGPELVVVVDDPLGWTWEVTTESGRISAVALRPHAGRTLDQHALSRAPLGYLREVALTFEADVDASYDDGLQLADALDTAERLPGELSLKSPTPTPAQFAQVWRATPAVTNREGERVTRRRALAQRFGVSVWAVDKWTRTARDAALIGPVGIREESKQ
jgi:hypothetical protein